MTTIDEFGIRALSKELINIASVMDQIGNKQEYWGPVLEASYAIDFLIDEISYLNQIRDIAIDIINLMGDTEKQDSGAYTSFCKLEKVLSDGPKLLPKELEKIKTDRHSAMEDIILEAKQAYEGWVYDDDTAGPKIEEIMGRMIQRYKLYRL